MSALDRGRTTIPDRGREILGTFRFVSLDCERAGGSANRLMPLSSARNLTALVIITSNGRASASRCHVRCSPPFKAEAVRFATEPEGAAGTNCRFFFSRSNSR
jgi:hypothetical protein